MWYFLNEIRSKIYEMDEVPFSIAFGLIAILVAVAYVACGVMLIHGMIECIAGISHGNPQCALGLPFFALCLFVYGGGIIWALRD